MLSSISARRLSLYALALVALTPTLGVLMWQHPTLGTLLPFAWRNLQRSFHIDSPKKQRLVPDVSAALKSDPNVGTTFSPSWRASLRRAAAPAVPASLLLYVGDCASCIDVDFAAYKREADRRGIGLVFLTRATPANAAQFAPAVRLSVGCVSDPKGALCDQLNCAWMARCYLVSRDGQLLWLQKTPTARYSPFSDPTFPADYKEVLR